MSGLKITGITTEYPGDEIPREDASSSLTINGQGFVYPLNVEMVYKPDGDNGNEAIPDTAQCWLSNISVSSEIKIVCEIDFADDAEENLQWMVRVTVEGIKDPVVSSQKVTVIKR